jgi:hypothetical protein
MKNPRNYPDVIPSAECGRPLRRGVKMLTIDVDGEPFTYGQPRWWASLSDPADDEGQFVDDDNIIWAAAHREARAKGRHATLTPLVIRAIRESCGLSQKEAAGLFGGGPKAFAARRPEVFQEGSGAPTISEADAAVLRNIVRRSSVEQIYRRIYHSSAESEPA